MSLTQTKMKDDPDTGVRQDTEKPASKMTHEEILASIDKIDKDIARVEQEIQTVRNETAAKTAGLYLFKQSASVSMHPVPCPCIGPILAHNQRIAKHSAEEYAHLFRFGCRKPMVSEEDVKKEEKSEDNEDVESEQAFLNAQDPDTLLQPARVELPTNRVIRTTPEHFNEVAKVMGERHCRMMRRGLRVSQQYLESMNVWRRKTLIHYAQDLAKMLPGGVAQAIAHVQAQAHQQKKVFKTRSGKVVGLNDPAAALSRCRTVLERMVAEAATNGVTVSFFQAQAATIPGMLPPDDPERRFAFNNKSLLVEDPVAQDEQFRKRTIWTAEDIETFKKKFAHHSKNFSKIAAHLPGKTVEDCVQFFYINKHKLQLKKQPPAEPPTPGRGGHKRTRTEHDDHDVSSPTTSTPPIDGEKGATAPPPKKSELGTPTSRKGEWQKEEKQRFFEALKLYGQDFAQIAKFVGSRNAHQCNNFYLSYKRRQQRTKEPSEPSPLVVKTENGALILPSAPEYVAAGNQQQKPHQDDNVPQRDIFDALGMDVLTADEEVVVLQKLAEYGKSWKQIAEALPSITQLHLRTWYKANDERLHLSKIAILGKRKKRSLAQQMASASNSGTSSPVVSPMFVVQNPPFAAQPIQQMPTSNLSILCSEAAVVSSGLQPQEQSFNVTPTVAIPASTPSVSAVAAATLGSLASVALPHVLPTPQTAAVPLIVSQTLSPQQQQPLSIPQQQQTLAVAEPQQQQQPQQKPQQQQQQSLVAPNPMSSLECLAQLAISEEVDDADDSQPPMDTK